MPRSLLPLVFLLTASLAGAGDAWTLPEEKSVLKEAAGIDAVKANCMLCHSAEYIATQPRFTREQWKASVTKMQQKFGAPIAAEAVEPLLDYLTQHYGKASQ